MATSGDVLQRMEGRVQELIVGLRKFVGVFDRAQLFTGPSLYFHFRTLEKSRQYSSPSEAVEDDAFLEYLYATLTA